jgi:hypothetical protein
VVDDAAIFAARADELAIRRARSAPGRFGCEGGSGVTRTIQPHASAGPPLSFPPQVCDNLPS